MLVEHQHTEQNRHRRVDIGDDRRAGRSDLCDQRKEDDKCGRRAHSRQPRHRPRHFLADVRGHGQRGRHRPHNRCEQQRCGRHADSRQVGKPARQHERAGCIAERRQQHRGHRKARDVSHLEADQRSDADETQSKSEQPHSIEDLSRANESRQHDAEQRHCGKKETGERTRDVLFGRRQQPPGSRHLDCREEEQRPPPTKHVEHGPATPRDRQQQQCRRCRAEEDDGCRAEVAHRDADQEIRNTPDHTHRGKEGPPPPRHSPYPFSLTYEPCRNQVSGGSCAPGRVSTPKIGASTAIATKIAKAMAGPTALIGSPRRSCGRPKRAGGSGAERRATLQGAGGGHGCE